MFYDTNNRDHSYRVKSKQFDTKETNGSSTRLSILGGRTSTPYALTMSLGDDYLIAYDINNGQCSSRQRINPRVDYRTDNRILVNHNDSPSMCHDHINVIGIHGDDGIVFIDRRQGQSGAIIKPIATIPSVSQTAHMFDNLVLLTTDQCIQLWDLRRLHSSSSVLPPSSSSSSSPTLPSSMCISSMMVSRMYRPRININMGLLYGKHYIKKGASRICDGIALYDINAIRYGLSSEELFQPLMVFKHRLPTNNEHIPLLTNDKLIIGWQEGHEVAHATIEEISLFGS
jgi:hypothetical protein